MALFTAFSGLDPMPWPAGHPNLFRTVEGNLYALCGLVVLAAATWWTFRTCAGSSGRMTQGLRRWIARMTRSRGPGP